MALLPLLVFHLLQYACGDPLPLSMNHGYAMTFQGRVPTAGTNSPFLNVTDPGWDLLEDELTMSMWVRHFDQVWDSSMDRYTMTIGHVKDGNFLQPFIGGRGFVLGSLFKWGYDLDMFNWHHFTVTIKCTPGSPTEINYFVDGTHHAQFTTPGQVQLRDVQSGELYFVLGPNLYTYHSSQPTLVEDYSFWGQMDEVAVFTRALNESEITDLYQHSLDPSTAASEDPHLALYYTFDPSCDDTTAKEANGLTDSSCFVSGKNEVRNLGNAGHNYNLQLGQLNNDNGFGQHWVPSSNSLANPVAFSKPQFTGSDIPTAFQRGPHPLVHYAMPGLNSTIALNFATGTVNGTTSTFAAGLTVTRVPAQNGTLFHPDTGVAVMVGDLISGDNQVVFSADTDMSGPAWFAVNITDAQGSIHTREVHVWPLEAPQASTEGKRSTLQEDDAIFSVMGPMFTSPNGLKLQYEVVAIPQHGRLFQVEYNSHVAGEHIASNGTLVLDPSGTVHFEPSANQFGIPYDELLVRAFVNVSDASVISSETSTWTIDVLAVDDVPISNDVHDIGEEDNNGILIQLSATEVEGQAIDYFITELPKKGKLYLTDNDQMTGNRTLVDREFEIFDMGNVIGQYASSVANVSTYWGSPLYTGYHALNILGRPTCDLYGECGDTRFENGEKPQVGDWIRINLFWDDPTAQATFVPGVIEASREVLGHGGVAYDTYDVKAISMFVDIGNDTNVPCAMIGPQYPADCDAATAATLPDGRATVIAANRSAVEALQAGVWSPATKAYLPETTLTNSYDVAFGEEYQYNHNQQAYYESSSPKYTEYIEVKFDEPVFPVSIEIGCPRGMGAIVSLKAMDPSGRWQRLYKQDVPSSEAAFFRNRKWYHRFSEDICQFAFKTNHLRIEMDTSAETGVSDWNYLDYVKLYGSLDKQNAMLRYPSHTLIYIPDQNAFGEDSFAYGTSDCPGQRFRSSDRATVHVSITPSDDTPLLKVDGLESNLVLLAPNEEREITLQVIEVDGGDAQALYLTKAPDNMEVVDANGVKLSASDSVAFLTIPGGAAGSKTDVVLTVRALPCESPFETQSPGTLTVVDSAGHSHSLDLTFSLDCVHVQTRFEFTEVDAVSEQVIVVTTSLGIMLSVLLIAFNVKYRRSHAVKVTSPVLNVVLISGSILVYVGLLFFKPAAANTDECADFTRVNFAENLDLMCESSPCCKAAALHGCTFRLWFFSLGLTVMLSALIVKTERIASVVELARRKGGGYNNQVRMQPVSDGTLLGLVLTYTVIVASILGFWSFSFKVSLGFQLGPTSFDTTNQTKHVIVEEFCTGKNFDMMLVILFCWFAVLIVRACMVAYRVRHVRLTQVNDSKQIIATVYNVVLFSAINLVISSLVEEHEKLYMFIFACAWVANTVTLVILFYPRCLDIMNGVTAVVTPGTYDSSITDMITGGGPPDDDEDTIDGGDSIAKSFKILATPELKIAGRNPSKNLVPLN